MLQLSIQGALGRTITPKFGVPEQELTALRTPVKRIVEEFLREREHTTVHEWSMDPYRKDTVKQVEALAAAWKAEGIQTVVWVGIGGSGLGPKVIQEVLEGPKTIEFHVVDTIDPAVLSLYREIIDWKKTAIVVVSKSGTTLETMSAFFLFWDDLRKAVRSKAAKRVAAVTDPHAGPLHDFCEREEIALLPIPKDVGGRYSIFTPVGLLPIALLGGNIQSFLRGAKEMDTRCQSTVIEENPAAELAALQFLLLTKRGYDIRVIMPYSQRLASIARWEEQLLAESLGKQETQNPMPHAAVGTQDQHSLLQQWMEGPRRAWHLFIQEEQKPELKLPRDLPDPFSHLSGKHFGELLDACMLGTGKGLSSANRPHATMTITRLDEFHLGQLFFCFLAEVVLLGKLLRIDPYGQPGVEAGKKFTKAILSKT